MSRFDDLPGYAASLGPLIDAVNLGVHIASRPLSRELAERSGLQADLLVDLRFVLPVRPLTPAGLAAVYRYNPLRRAEIDVHLAQGTLAEDDAPEATPRTAPPAAPGAAPRTAPHTAPDAAPGAASGIAPGAAGTGALRATPVTRAFIASLYEVHAAVTGRLWAAQADRLPELAGVAGRLVEAGAATGGAAFAQVAPPYEPPGTPPGVLLFNRLAVLRYHRADAHAGAWGRAGLTAAQMISLPPGPVRERIEAGTNDRAARPYETLTTRDRQAFLLGLSALDLP
ncbi:hypothetical protein ACLQ2R_05735 [Streptosporangium sp. DT93]|uniref:hypothetical protein n=1 Tax=Streptosporangium sp. DT93 TaxID=3393428 RepID=UPI003CE6EEAF